MKVRIFVQPSPPHPVLLLQGLHGFPNGRVHVERHGRVETSVLIVEGFATRSLHHVVDLVQPSLGDLFQGEYGSQNRQLSIWIKTEENIRKW